MTDDKMQGIEAEDRPTAERLHSERPVPDPNFRGALRRRLMADGNGWQRAPFLGSIRIQIAGYLGTGVVLLAVAAAGLVGAGPFGA